MVCLWLPNWPLQRLRHERPELQGRAVVLFSTSGNRGPRVVACSASATQQGVSAGMPLAEAQALMNVGLCSAKDRAFAERKPTLDAHFELHDPAADVVGLRKLAQTCDRFSPVFGIEDGDSPDCILLDIAGCSHLFGSERNLAAALASQFQQQGFQVRVGIAPTIGAAWGAAHYLAKANDQPILDDHELGAALARLPVSALRLPFKIVETLHELGLRSIGQLRALPRESLPSRFGSELLRRLDQTFGDAPELLVPERPSEPAAVTWITEEPLTDRESLKIVCRELIEDLLRQLQPQREGVRRLLCQFKGVAARPVELVIHFVSPCDVAKHVLELLSLQIDRADLPEGISFGRLEATEVGSLVTRQRDLFGFQTDTESHREVSSLLDRLSNRLGATAVVRATLVADAQPELAVGYESVAVERKTAEGQGLRGEGNRRRQAPSCVVPCLSALSSQPVLCSSALSPQPSTRPLRLFTPPQPIDAAAAGPEGAPIHFRWDRRDHRVIRSWGPERIETGWWRESSVRRDYFRVETQTGQHFWLFRCFNQAAWFIHGAFE